MSDVSTWSTTAASNNSASPDGWPESMAPSGVNNSARENMAQIATWRQKLGGWMMENVGLSATVGSGNLTVTLRVKNGSSAPSSTNKVGIGFRSATLTTGGFDYVEATSAIDVTLPSGGTLGFANSAIGYVFVYAINNAGTMELALSGQSVFDEGIVHSTTGIGTGSDSSNVLYSGSGRTDVAVRLIGRITIQHGAGTWTNSPTVIALWSPEMMVNSVPRVLYRTSAVVTVSDTSSETDLLNYSVPANTLGTDNKIEVSANISFIHNHGGAATFNIKVYYGATNIANHDLAPSGTDSTNARPLKLSCSLYASGATNTQKSLTTIFHATVGQTEPNGDSIELTTDHIAHETSIGEDSTAAKNFRITVAHTVANSGQSTSLHEATVMLYPG